VVNIPDEWSSPDDLRGSLFTDKEGLSPRNKAFLRDTYFSATSASADRNPLIVIDMAVNVVYMKYFLGEKAKLLRAIDDDGGDPKSIEVKALSFGLSLSLGKLSRPPSSQPRRFRQRRLEGQT